MDRMKWGIDQPRSFDAVVANSPYSAKWDNRASKLKDSNLNNDGTMAIVLPHGVLFRRAAEKKIRQKLIEKDNAEIAVLEKEIKEQLKIWPLL